MPLHLENTDRFLRAMANTSHCPRSTQHTATIGFDDVLNQLGSLPRLYAEPDGSFVWTSPHDHARWQVNGNLYERNDSVLFVEIKGSCPASEFDQLLACFLPDEKACVVQLTRPAVFVTAEVFRVHAAARGQAGDGGQPASTRDVRLVIVSEAKSIDRHSKRCPSNEKQDTTNRDDCPEDTNVG